MLTYPMYAVLFDFCVPCPQTKILIFQGTLIAKRPWFHPIQGCGLLAFGLLMDFL